MRRLVCGSILSLLMAVSLSAPAMADSRAHHAAVKLCKRQYKDAIRGSKYLKGHQRRARIDQARRDREECERLAPR